MRFDKSVNVDGQSRLAFAPHLCMVAGYVRRLAARSERGRLSICVNGNWRVSFEFKNGKVFILDCEDYR